MPVRLPSKIKEQFSTVITDLKLPRDILPYIRPFVVNGFDLFHAGSTYIKSGSVIGIPINFTYESVDDIDTSTLLVGNRKIKWDRTEGKELLESLVISDNAKKFAIAQEIYRCQTLEPLLNSFYPIFNVSLAYILGKKINQFTNGFSRPLTYRIVVYLLVGLFSFGNWAFLKDFTTIHYDTESIEKISELGPDYVEGGQEFYANILRRNKALRHLLGNEGVKLYSATGNEQFFLREKRLPIASRKLLLDKRVENIDLKIS